MQRLMLNILEDKVALCERMGIRITSEQWAVNQLPAVMVTDGGSEYKGQTFEQIAELGVTLVNLPTYRPELKGSVLQKEAYVRYKAERHRCLAEHHASNV